MKIEQAVKILKTLLLFLFISGTAFSQKKIDIIFKEETKADINQYAFEKSKKMIDSTDIYVFKNFKGFAEHYNEGKLQVPEILFFNSSGYLVKNRFNANECTQVITDIKNIDKMKFDANVNITDYTQRIAPLNTLPPNNENKVYDYYIIINWAKYTEKFNKQSFEWYADFKKSGLASRVKLYFLDLDVQKSWNMNEKQKAVLKIK